MHVCICIHIYIFKFIYLFSYVSATQSPLIIQLSDQPLEGTPLPQSPRVYALHLRAKSNRE